MQNQNQENPKEDISPVNLRRLIHAIALLKELAKMERKTKLQSIDAEVVRHFGEVGHSFSHIDFSQRN